MTRASERDEGASGGSVALRPYFENGRFRVSCEIGRAVPTSEPANGTP